MIFDLIVLHLVLAVIKIKNLMHKEEPKSKLPMTSMWLKENTFVSGWTNLLLFLNFIIAYRYLQGCFYITPSSEDPVDHWGDLLDLFIGIEILLINIYIVYAVNYRKPNAVFWATRFAAYMLICNTLLLFADIDIFIIICIVINIATLLYFKKSANIREIIPMEFRKVSKWDKVIFAVAAGLPFVLFIVLLVWVFITFSE